MTFSKILKAVEREYSLTDHDLHHKLNVSEETILSWKEGRSFPDRHALEDFSAMFAIPLKTLVDSCQTEEK